MEVTRWWTGFGSCVIWPLSVVLCLKTWSTVVVPIYKGEGEMTKCKNYRGISLSSVVGKLYADSLVDRVRSVTGGLIDDEQGVFRAGRGYVDQIFTLIQIDEKA